ncbi:2-dehydropantoate 2-reductase [Mesorhizobium sp. ASY16-5R]|uniref:2-dehydropantoate 2-reductase n=1 Tax=Mesorhizobium sp. ASY16-5R TaxID=3445772 RepID=UPI003FA0D602
METPPTICVFGAGSIGCYIGGRLAVTGAKVRLIGRPRFGEAIAKGGLRLADHLGADFWLEPGSVDYQTDPKTLADAALVLVTVKAGDTTSTAAVLAEHAPSQAIIISFQNGIANEEILRAALPGRTVLAGMVPFNVVQLAGPTFKQATQGALDIEASAAILPFLPIFEKAGLPLTQHADFRPVQWGKLLLNLNNAVSGLSGLTLREELSQRAYRQCLAMAQREALAAMKAAGIRPAKLTSLPPALVPWLLGLPDWLFLRLAGSVLEVDPAARSSMIDALDAGRRTDVDWLNGEVIRLAEKNGVPAPVNRKLVKLVHEAETGNRRRWSGPDLLAQLRSGR